MKNTIHYEKWNSKEYEVITNNEPGEEDVLCRVECDEELVCEFSFKRPAYRKAGTVDLIRFACKELKYEKLSEIVSIIKEAVDKLNSCWEE